jgi:hypothetical protein
MERALLLMVLLAACAHARKPAAKYAGPKEAVMDPAKTFGPSTTLLWR